MYDIIFTTESKNEIIIATTRPELSPAAVAIFYHPNDNRYQHLKNQKAIVPLFHTVIPIIPDPLVCMEKGTGLVMCSTFGDTIDINWWRKHFLPLRIIISENGTICNLDNIGTPEWPCIDLEVAKDNAKQISGLNIKDARKKIISMLNTIVVKKTAIKHHVKCAERSGTPIEILVTPQWFIKILDQKVDLQKKSNQCLWHPTHMQKNMEQWINGLNWDWCISRQRFFGVPFPIWYSKRIGEEGKILVPDLSSLPVDPNIDLPKGYDRCEVQPETDVMDTWATSSLTPQINSWGISDSMCINSDRHSSLFPADLRPQAHEIIRSWAFYTIVKAHYHQNSIPWSNVMISGWCLDNNRDKMAKSKGNIVSPINLIDKYGADVVRYWVSSAKLGSDIAYTEKTMIIGKKLITKLWNATKFVSTHLYLVKRNVLSLSELMTYKLIYEAMDLWLLCKLKKTINKASNFFEEFEYNEARKTIEHFFWNDFCDNYLELIKGRVYDNKKQNPAGVLSATYTLYHALDAIIKMFAPFIPHITEELYQTYFANGKLSVHSQGTWPCLTNEIIIDEKYENLGDMLIGILDVIRKTKANKKISLKTPIKTLIINQNTNTLLECNELHLFIPDLASVSNIETITFVGVPTVDALITNDGFFKVSVIF